MFDKKKLLERIVIDPNIMVGKPIIKGTRLTVQQILTMLTQDMTTEEILEEYPHITKTDIKACLAFATETLDDTTFVPLSSNA